MEQLITEYENLIKVYRAFLEKTNDRVNRFKLSTKYCDICTFFEEKNGVVINTIHGVKGEEYTTVIGFCLLNGIIPHWSYIYDDNMKPLRNCATKRLLYVLMSRAKKNLYLFSETGRTTNKGTLLLPTDELNQLS